MDGVSSTMMEERRLTDPAIDPTYELSPSPGRKRETVDCAFRTGRTASNATGIESIFATVRKSQQILFPADNEMDDIGQTMYNDK